MMWGMIPPELQAQIAQQAREATVAPAQPVEREHPKPVAEDLGLPRWEPTPWPEAFDESEFRDHLDALHARAMSAGRVTWPNYVKRVEWWCARYDAAQADNERMAKRLTFLQELAAACPAVGVPEPLRHLVLEVRRGPWTPEALPAEDPAEGAA